MSVGMGPVTVLSLYCSVPVLPSQRRFGYGHHSRANGGFILLLSSKRQGLWPPLLFASGRSSKVLRQRIVGERSSAERGERRSATSPDSEGERLAAVPRTTIHSPGAMD